MSLPPEFVELATVHLQHEDGTVQAVCIAVVGDEITSDGCAVAPHVSMGAYALKPAQARALAALLVTAARAAEHQT